MGCWVQSGSVNQVNWEQSTVYIYYYYVWSDHVFYFLKYHCFVVVLVIVIVMHCNYSVKSYISI